MRREMLIPLGALVVVALFLAVSTLGRMHQGRCRIGHTARYSALDCTYPNGTFRPWP